MKDHEIYPPIVITKARKEFLYSQDGQKIIDAISSWWCKSLGHSHPKIRKAVKKQIKIYEHIIPAGTTQKNLVKLSEYLCEILPELKKIFFSDSGSSAIEIAAKMALQYHLQTGNPSKNYFVTFQNAYHGETSLALSLGDCQLYSAPYKSILYKNIINLSPLPYVSGKTDPNWEKIPDQSWEPIEKKLNENSAKIAAIFFEPIVQGAGGMLVYSKNFLQRIAAWAKKNNVLLVADEIMTGFYRTGEIFASIHAKITPDIICISKGLTAGWGAMSAVLTTEKIFNAFYDEYLSGKAFLHSSTYTGNAICTAAALEALRIYEKEKIRQYVMDNENEIQNAIDFISKETNSLANIRGIGFIAAADIINPKTKLPFPREKRIGFQFYQRALKKGAFMRNLGDSIYILPPLNTRVSVIRRLSKIAAEALNEVIKINT